MQIRTFTFIEGRKRMFDGRTDNSLIIQKSICSAWSHITARSVQVFLANFHICYQTIHKHRTALRIVLPFIRFPVQQFHADLTIFVRSRFENIQASDQTHFLPLFRRGAVLLKPTRPSTSPTASTTAGYGKVESAAPPPQKKVHS